MMHFLDFICVKMHDFCVNAIPVYHSQSAKLPLIVAEVDGKPAIIARNWPSVLKVNWSKDLFNVSSLDLVN